LISELFISNYKTLKSATFPIAPFTVLIGENGAGKSNILEALVLASAASGGKLERELLVARGVRMTTPELMRSAFDSTTSRSPVVIRVQSESPSESQHIKEFRLDHPGDSFADWKVANGALSGPEQIQRAISAHFKSLPVSKRKAELAKMQEESKALAKFVSNVQAPGAKGKKTGPSKSKPLTIHSTLIQAAFGEYIESESLKRFTVYSPDYYTLRNFVRESQTAPLGIRGEGLLTLLSSMWETERSRLSDITAALKMLGWFGGIATDQLATAAVEGRLLIKDRFIRRRGLMLDQMSTNEGFLYCLFYLTLFTSSATPNAFAIENIENGLNPKLCESLLRALKKIAKKYGKQAVISTHSPATLDALDLDSKDDLLLAVDRNLDGHTRVTQIKKPKSFGGKVTRLSEAFLLGQIGGIPRNFV
jgi:predicted ATPase